MVKVLAAVLVFVALATGAIALSARGSGPREIRIVVRHMTFYLEGSGAANPTLRLRAGETVRLVLRNEDRGMKHDFTVPAWNAATPLIPVQREAEVLITAPARGSRATYHCTPHEETMRGTIIVE